MSGDTQAPSTTVGQVTRPDDMATSAADEIDIVMLFEEGDGALMSYHCEEHIDPKAFLAAMDDWLDDDQHVDPSAVSHRWLRWVPGDPEEGEEHDVVADIRMSHMPGSIPITYLDAGDIMEAQTGPAVGAHRSTAEG